MFSGDAPIPADDTILIVDLTSVHGLERAVIVIIPEVKPPPPLPAGYDGILPPVIKEKPVSPDPQKRDRLPQDIQETIDGKQAGGKDDITQKPDGEVEEDLPDDAEGAVTKCGSKTDKSIDPVFVKHDPKIKEALKSGKDLTVTAEGAVEADEPPADEDVEMRDEEQPAGGDDHPKGDHPPPVVPKPDAEMRDVSADAGSKVNTATHQAAQAPSRQQEEKDPDIPVEKKDPYTYTDSHSAEQIKAALESLSLQSRQDVFYIGSRAVCQLILVHNGKDPSKEDRSEEPMQTG